MTLSSSAETGAAPVTIAIDGPAGSGKSSVSKQVARELGYGYLDTGAAYRALAWHALAQDADTADPGAVLAAAAEFPYAISLDPDDYWVRVGETDVTDAIREPRVSDAVSGVARVPAVRAQVTELFRALVAESGLPGVVVEGRDITTVVAPDAQVRILMTASEEARLARRSKELSSTVEATRSQIVDRDKADSTVSQFMTAADGVLLVDTSDLTFEQSLAAVLQIVQEAIDAGERA